MYNIFRCAFDFDRNSGHLTPTTLNCGITRKFELGKIDIITVVEANAGYPRHDSASIVELTDGRLLLAWMEHVGGELIGHDHGPCNIASMISSDGGRTWTDRRILVENHPDDTNIHFPCFLRLKSGEILFYYLRHHLLKPGSPVRSSAFVCRSRDEGETFSAPTRHNIGGNVLTQLFSGRIILPQSKLLHGIWGGPKDHQVAGCYYSDDDGHSWKASASWVDLPLRGAMEPHIAELKDDRLLMYMRTQLGAIFQSESRDGGVTWSLPQTTGLKAPESMPCLTKIQKTGDLLLIWNNSHYAPAFDHYGKRTPLTAAISKDEGHSWENFKNIESDPNWEFTNPSCYFTSQDRIIITYVASAMDDPNPPGRLDRSRMPLKAAIADIEWLYE